MTTYGELELFAKWEEGSSPATTTAGGVETTVTTAPESTTPETTTNGETASKGCGSTIGAGAAFAIVSVIGTGLVLGKKKTK